METVNVGKSYVHVVKVKKTEIDKIDFDVCAQPREKLQNFYNRQIVKPDILTNLGLFGMNSSGLPCFSLISDYKQYAYDGQTTIGLGVTSTGELVYGEHKEKNWKHFCSAYPMLVVDGKKVEITYATELAYRTRRTCVGYNDNYIFVVCVDSPGMKYDELQDLGISLGAKYFANFDGGGSTRMLLSGETVTNGLENRAIDNALCIYLKKETEKEPAVTIHNKGGQTLRIYEDIIPQKGGKVRPGTKRNKKWIVIHETGNTSKGANAKGHSSYLKNLAIANNTSISWHYTVDDECAYHHIPDDEVAWHASDGSVEGGGNMAGIAIEICVNSDGDFSKARDNAAWLTAKLLKEHGLGITNVKQHHDFARDKKNCPENIRNKGLWNNFLSAVQKYYGGTTSTSASNTSTSTVADFKVGDIVQFTGNTHYKGADATTGHSCKPGKAKIGKVYRLGKSKHPYMVTAVSGGGSTVYGWVDVDDLQELAKEGPKAYTAKVTANVLNVRSTPSTSGRVVTTIKKGEVYTIVEEKNGFGRLKSGQGWISLKYVKLVKYI